MHLNSVSLVRGYTAKASWTRVGKRATKKVIERVWLNAEAKVKIACPLAYTAAQTNSPTCDP
jgi:hypothetical protein